MSITRRILLPGLVAVQFVVRSRDAEASWSLGTANAHAGACVDGLGDGRYDGLNTGGGADRFDWSGYSSRALQDTYGSCYSHGYVDASEGRHTATPISTHRSNIARDRSRQYLPLYDGRIYIWVPSSLRWYRDSGGDRRPLSLDRGRDPNVAHAPAALPAYLRPTPRERAIFLTMAARHARARARMP